VCALCLVGSAAGPLAGDRVTLTLDVRDGARAVLSAAGANLAQGRSEGAVVPAAAGRLESQVRVGESADLHAEPAALIVSAGSTVSVSVSLELAATAAVLWRELLVLGRTAEESGAVSLHWSVHRAGSPVLVQSIDLTGDRSWPGLLDGNRVIASTFVSRPGLLARTIVDSATAVCQKLDEHSMLITVLDIDAASAQGRLDELLGSIEG
jgi:urease accessory protein